MTIVIYISDGEMTFNNIFKERLAGMLRKDTIHMIKTEWEPKVPDTGTIKAQMKNYN